MAARSQRRRPGWLADALPYIAQRAAIQARNKANVWLWRTRLTETRRPGFWIRRESGPTIFSACAHDWRRLEDAARYQRMMLRRIWPSRAPAEFVGRRY